jgi:hypothetical protein
MHVSADNLRCHGAHVWIRVAAQALNRRAKDERLRWATVVVLTTVASERVQGMHAYSRLSVPKHADQCGEGIVIDEVIHRLGALRPHLWERVLQAREYGGQRVVATQHEVPVRLLRS